MRKPVLREVQPNPGWTEAEWVMENITGSAYEFRFHTDRMTGDVRFERLRQPLEDGRRTFVIPDRRHRAKQDADGYWQPTA